MPDLDVIHLDDRVLVLNKPSGLLSVPGIGPDNQDCLARRAETRFPGARIIHRLDRDTSGVLVLALDADGHRDLSRQFEQRRVEKSYLAVAAGLLANDTGRIDLPLRKDMDSSPTPRYIVDHEQGRAAETLYRVVERDGDRTRLELTPRTGRSHQLRVHLAALGHPILGDDLYAPPDVIAMARRLMLHAASLTIAHPSNGQRLTFESPCPF